MSRWGIVIDLNRLSAYPSSKSAGTNEGAGHSVFPRGDKEADDSFFAECLGGLQTMQTLNQHKARAVRPHQDRCLLAVVQLLVAISSTRFCSSVVRRFIGT